MNYDHSDSQSLEHLVRSVNNCDRHKFGNLINADVFDRHPFYAVILVLFPLYSPKTEDRIDRFVSTYMTVFDYPEDNAEYTFDRFYKELDELVNYCRNI